MMTDTKISVVIGSLTFYFDSFTETFGTEPAEVACYDGVYRAASGTKARRLSFSGRLTKDQVAAYEAMKSYTGSKISITVDSTQISSMILESVKISFESGALMGTVTAEFSEVS
jgi:hypothetical protein